MAIDSLYGAYLKATAPYQFYTVLLKLYTDKGNKTKLALIIEEMKRYAGITLIAGRFGEDNRDWFFNSENHTISQSLSSIKFMNKTASRDLYLAGQQSFATFTDLLRHLQMHTKIDTRQVGLLIDLNYFASFGRRKKLTCIAKEFYEGPNKLTKTIKSYEKRLEALRQLEASLPDEELPIDQIVKAEHDLVGLCLSSDGDAESNLYFVEELDDKYRVVMKLYSLRRGTSGQMRISKSNYASCPVRCGQIIALHAWKSSPKYAYRNGKRVVVEGEQELWAKHYEVVA